jgi:4-phosphopantoate--beta-alanine ligase
MHRRIGIRHPRAVSLYTRELLVDGYKKGIVVTEGLIAHGRGEAFDYLLREQTTEFAQAAIRTASAALLLANYPVISVNGNSVALCARQIVELSKITHAVVEVNLFHRSKEREIAIEKELRKKGANLVYGVGSAASSTISELQSDRRRVDPQGIYKADTVLVPLEDGDRTEALVKMGKKVIAVDLNPLSRTASAAQITIVDNVVRAIPHMISEAKRLKGRDRGVLSQILQQFSNQQNLSQSLQIIRGGSNGRSTEKQ